MEQVAERVGAAIERVGRTGASVEMGALQRHFQAPGRSEPLSVTVWGCPSRPSLREAPGRWGWSRWSARSEARSSTGSLLDDTLRSARQKIGGSLP